MTGKWKEMLTLELARIDNIQATKRDEKIITGFSTDYKAIVDENNYLVFNSNDYLGLRFNKLLKTAADQAAEKYGNGPGAVRFISGSLKIHKDLEDKIARFHGREDAVVVSSAFAANIGVLSSLIKGQSQDSKVMDKALVISDELNHRSIIDGIRVANILPEQKRIFKHLDSDDLARVLEENKNKFDRVIVVTDGVFSMLGQYQDLGKLRKVITEFERYYDNGIILVVDDCHGIGAIGKKGRGTEEVTGAQADVLVGTLGKAFGTDGGYITGDKVTISYLREAAATYIYSNSIAPGTAGAALAAVNLVDSEEGVKLLTKSRERVNLFKSLLEKTDLKLAADSRHPIQPILIGDAAQTVALKDKLWKAGIWVTNINYPVVAKGKDEIRVQISALHSEDDIKTLVRELSR